MFSPMGAGLMAGSALISGISQRNANERERRRFRRMLKKRRTSPEGQALSSAVSRYRELAETLPGQIRSNLRGQAVAQQQANLAKLNRSLAQKGYTSGSSVYGRQQRGAIGDLISQQGRIENQTGQLQGSLLSGAGNLAQRAGQYFNPMAMGPEEQFIDPMSIITQAGIGGILGGELFGGTPNNVYGQNNAVSGAFPQYSPALSPFSGVGTFDLLGQGPNSSFDPVGTNSVLL